MCFGPMPPDASDFPGGIPAFDIFMCSGNTIRVGYNSVNKYLPEFNTLRQQRLYVGFF